MDERDRALATAVKEAQDLLNEATRDAWNHGMEVEVSVSRRKAEPPVVGANCFRRVVPKGLKLRGEGGEDG